MFLFYSNTEKSNSRISELQGNIMEKVTYKHGLLKSYPFDLS